MNNSDYGETSNTSQPMVSFTPMPMVSFKPTPMVTFLPTSSVDTDCNDKHNISSLHNKKNVKALLPPEQLLTTANVNELKENIKPDNQDIVDVDSERKESIIQQIQKSNKKQEIMVQEAQERVLAKASSLPIVQATIENTSYTYDGKYLYFDDEPVCNFSIILLEEIVVINANSLKRFSKYKVRIIVNMDMFDSTVMGEMLDQFNWVKKLTSGKAFIKDNDSYKLYIHYLLSSPINKSRFEFDRSGWIPINKKYYYVTDKGPLGLNRPDITTNDKKEFNYNPDKIRSNDVYRSILELMTGMCKNSEISVLLELFTHLGVMTTPFDQAGYPPKFVMGLIGETNSRKTSMAIALTQIFNRDKVHHPEISFFSTTGGIETRLQTYSDAILLVDDFIPANTARQQYDNINKLEFLVRAYGDHVSKVRMTDFGKSGLQESYPIRGCCLITGEYIEGICSSMTRMILLNIDKHQVNNQLLTYHQKNYNILTTHFYDFLSYIAENYNETIEFIQNRMQALRNLAATYFCTPRFAESYSHLQTMSEIFLGYGLKRGFITSNEYDYYICHFEHCIHKAISENDHEVIKKNVEIMFLLALKSSIDNGKLECITYNDPILRDRNYAYSDKDYIYIKLETAFMLAKNYWSSYGKYLPITTEDQLLQYLIPLGLILRKREGNNVRNTHKLPNRKKGDNTRYLYIIKSVMDEKLTDVLTL